MIDMVFEQLRNDSVCKSAYQFSREFLGKSSSYYSVLKTRKQNPSTDVLFTLEYALENKAKLYSRNNYPFFIRTRNHLLQMKEEVRRYRENKIMSDFINFKASASITNAFLAISIFSNISVKSSSLAVSVPNPGPITIAFAQSIKYKISSKAFVVNQSPGIVLTILFGD